MKPSSITIFHNPQCSTSRNVLAAIRETGAEPEVIDYLKQPYTQEQLAGLLQAMGMSAGELLRRKGDLYAGLAEAKPDRSDAEWLDLMVQYPVLVERPIVVTPRGTVLCRPKERLRDVL
ncbi:arsenate reductase (glutaredoxin) [Hydrogenophaga pseudoflava]|uniref:arsenate reductase (glutaredoxin) n=1 Tax=Hydrogenophaga pseudoflava TaxID=47421 RepID=UPI0027E4DAE2|nr:arsenate reductase (glutaredoxin) [Hydrogenophaga pseudoflava]MDQ7744096.1 arsenate reductase (glutaredoxin) [Hydrogenophaga pseudoflava]